MAYRRRACGDVAGFRGSVWNDDRNNSRDFKHQAAATAVL